MSLFRFKKKQTLFEIFKNNEGRIIHKWHHYFDIYEKHFSKFVNKSPVILELGVQNGGSLEMWKKYFGKGAIIVGVDIDERCKQLNNPKEGINVIICDLSNKDDIKEKILSKYSNFDIIIDDASHLADHQITAFNNFYDYLNDDGIYLVEDIHCNYWKDFDIYKQNAPKPTTTFLDFINDRAKDMMRYHFDDEGNSFFSINSKPIKNRTKEDVIDTPLFTKKNYAIHIYDSVVVLEKKNITQPVSSFSGKIRII